MRHLQALGEQWARLSRREQSLAILVGVAVAVWLILTGFRLLWMRIEDVDREILSAENMLVEAVFQNARREAVEAEYREVAAQHSSAWNEAEVLDRLRNEMYRLAYNAPSPLNEDGVASQVENDSGLLVNLPELGEGVLDDREEGKNYREFHISARVADATLPAMICYIERLQASPQSLRIDGFQLNRNFGDNKVTVNIDITRIIVDRAEAAWTHVGQDIAEWKGGGCKVEAAAQPGTADAAVRFTATGPRGIGYLVLDLEPGVLYELTIDATAKGAATLGIYDETAKANLTGQIPLVKDEDWRQYRVQFALKGSDEAAARARVPLITLGDASSEVVVSRVAYRKAL